MAKFLSSLTILVVCILFFLEEAKDSYVQRLPNIEPAFQRLATQVRDFSSVITDRHGNTLAQPGARRQGFATLAAIPQHTIAAFLAAEDSQFYKHGGIDYSAVLRAAWENLTHSSLRQGASTITQQLARMAFLGPEKTWERKWKEALMAGALEQKFSKDQIIELYLNLVYLGAGSYGIAAAAENYFGKTVTELTIPESALLAGLPKAPSRLSPARRPKLALQRRNFVIQRMVQEGFLTTSQALRFSKEKLRLTTHRTQTSERSYRQWVTRDLKRRFDISRLETSGMKIQTSIDLRFQQILTQTLTEQISRLDADPGKTGRLEGAAVLLDNRTGALRAIVGGRGDRDNWWDRATRMRRPLGSALKPLYRLLQKQHSPAGKSDLMSDRKALGQHSVFKYIQRLGLASRLRFHPKALSQLQASPIRLASALATLARGTAPMTPWVTSTIQSRDGGRLYQKWPYPQKQIYETQVVKGLFDDFSDECPVKNVACHAGTTTNDTDGWFVAWDRTLVLILWLGGDDGKTRITGKAGNTTNVLKHLGKTVLSAIQERAGYSFQPVNAGTLARRSPHPSFRPSSDRSTDFELFYP